MAAIQDRRNVGIFAHVDAGKTTTTEHILYESGRIRRLGSVDDGTAQTDWLDVERDRGISVRAAATRFVWRGVEVNLVDTPGHVDFMSEVERSLRVMDGAILIVSAVEGVQAQTELIWQALRKLGIPTLLYVNKMDRIGASAERVLEDVRKYLSPGAVPVQVPMGIEDSYEGSVSLWHEDAAGIAGYGSAWADMAEKLAERDESVMERYLADERIPPAELREKTMLLTKAGELFPVLFGASGKGIGVAALMDAVVELLPPPTGDENGSPSGIVFKLERDKAMGRLAYVRMYDGRIENRDLVRNLTQGIDEKVTQIRRMEGRRGEDAGVLSAGDIAAVCGFSRVRIGDVLGSGHAVPDEARLAVPLLTVQAHWANEQDYPAVVAALQELSDEDPLLDLRWLQEERELHLKVTGPIQLEILTSVLQSRYGLHVAFGEPTVIYQETPKRTAEGFIAYTMPKPCWAILRFLIEPGERGSGLVYRAEVRKEDLLDSYQNEVARRVPEALQQGLYGWQVTDLKVTLTYGEHHVWHTHPLDFVVATPMGIMDGLTNTGTALLEPILRFRLSVPEEFGGRIMHELVQMRAEFDSPAVRKDRMTVEGLIPAATSLDFPVRLGSMTKGRGSMATFFDGYRECPPAVKAERPRRGVDPRDQAKYILSVRKALSQ